MSPRNSQASQSDKSKKSVSPRHTQSILPNTGAEAGGSSSSLPHGEKRSSQQVYSENHAAKLARIEAPGSEGFPKIDEGVEPSDG